VNLVVSSGVAQVQVDNVIGQDGGAAQTALKAQGLQVSTSYSGTFNSTYPANEVVQETYNGTPVTQGMQVPSGGVIDLVLNPANPAASNPPSPGASTSTNPSGGAAGTTSTQGDTGNPGDGGDPGNGNGNGD